MKVKITIEVDFGDEGSSSPRLDAQDIAYTMVDATRGYARRTHGATLSLAHIEAPCDFDPDEGE